MLFLQIVLAGLFSGLLQLTAHLIVLMYCPKLDMVPRYIIGTLGLLLPASVYLVLTGSASALLPIWMCAGASGVAVLGARALGKRIVTLQNKLDELERYRVLDGKTEKED